MQTQCKRKPDAKVLLQTLDNLCIDMFTAAKQNLPTRHVTLKSRGGLIFASKEYYELMEQIEDRFYSTVCCCCCLCTPHTFHLNTQVTMRQNFALAKQDAIVNIRRSLLHDSVLVAKFERLVEPHTEKLWGLFVDRISNLHGTELAGESMKP